MFTSSHIYDFWEEVNEQFYYMPADVFRHGSPCGVSLLRRYRSYSALGPQLWENNVILILTTYNFYNVKWLQRTSMCL